MTVLAIILIFLAAILALIKHRWLMLAYVASLGWLPYDTGVNIVGPIDLDDFLLMGVVLLSLPWLFRRGFPKLGRIGKFALAYWVLSLISNLVRLCLRPDVTHIMALRHLHIITLHQMLKDTAMMLFIITMEGDLWDRNFVQKLVVALCVAALGVAISTFTVYLLPGSGIARLLLPQYSAIALGRTRYGGTVGTTFVAGSYMLGAFGILVALLVAKSRGALKLLAIIGLPLLITAVLAGQSRATYVGIAVILMCALMKLRQAAITIPLVLIGLGAISMDPDLSARLFGRIGATTATFSGRTELWVNYLRNAPITVFLIGEGFTVQSIREVPMHMSYMEVLGDTGVLGVILFTSLWYHVLTARRRIRHSAETTIQLTVGRAAVWISVAFLISSAAIGLIVNNSYRLAFMLWLSVALAPAWEASPQEEDIALLDYGIEVPHEY